MRIGLKNKDFYKHAFSMDYDYSDIPTLFEADGITCGDVVNFNGKHYAICSTSTKHNFSAAEEIEISDDGEDEVNDNNIKCPVCGKENEDSWEYSNESDDYECGTCGSTLSYMSEITRTFYIKVKSRPEIKQVVGSKTEHTSEERKE